MQPIDFALPLVHCHLCCCLVIDKRSVSVLFSSCSSGNLLRKRSRTHYIRRARRTGPVHTPCHRRLDPTVVCRYCLHVHVAFLHCRKLLQCSRILAVLPRLHVHVLMDWHQPHFAHLPPQVWRMLLSGPRRLRDASQVQDRFPLLQVILAQHSSVCGCQQTTCAAQRCSKLRHQLLCDVDASAMLFISGSIRSRFSHNFGVHHRNVSAWCSKIVINFHTSVTQQQMSVPTFFFHSSPNTSTHHCCCSVAHDVLSRSHVETEPTTVQPLHSKFLQRSCCLFHAVIADIQCRQCPCMLHISQAMSTISAVRPRPPAPDDRIFLLFV